MIVVANSAGSFVHSAWHASFVAALMFIGSLGSQAMAQNTAQDPRGGERSPDCLPRATRLREHCDPIKVVVRVEGKTEVSLDLPTPATVYCAAVIGIEYTQRNTVVAIVGTLSTADCVACSGEYEMAVTVRDQDLGLKTLKFVESWERQDDQPVSFSLEYPIGQNVDVTGVRARQLRCTCVEPEKNDGSGPAPDAASAHQP